MEPLGTSPGHSKMLPRSSLAGSLSVVGHEVSSPWVGSKGGGAFSFKPEGSVTVCAVIWLSATTSFGWLSYSLKDTYPLVAHVCPHK